MDVQADDIVTVYRIVESLELPVVVHVFDDDAIEHVTLVLVCR